MHADGPVLECSVSFKRNAHARRPVRVRLEPTGGRVPRVARLMALSVKLEGQIRAGELRDWAEVANLAHVTRARASQIAALLLLAPDIIEAILHLPLVERGRDPVTERDLRHMVSIVSWSKQRRLWAQLCGEQYAGTTQ